MQKPVVVETGCIRAEDDFTAGWFAGVFGLWVDAHGGTLDSVDMSRANVSFARK
ncbi:hypothetical protein R5W24_003370 [Gemmata sp. JC717]|uniref:Uncharacterized protein n=1 Tax=Gemmata algarum TaxID=2975278 RepID=A0ABU5F6K5_9BACT|nr:hypothetical protein [Gemmata algarum]MDY3554251.1 hypothetical protein [Gemmata algarum]MDY3562940.1 hypothetical protein [Gemmata algarum]